MAAEDDPAGERDGQGTVELTGRPPVVGRGETAVPPPVELPAPRRAEPVSVLTRSVVDYETLVSAVLEVARFDGFDGLDMTDPETLLERNPAVRHVYRRELAQNGRTAAFDPAAGSAGQGDARLPALAGALTVLRRWADSLEQEVEVLESDLVAAREELEWWRRQAEADAAERSELLALVSQALALVPAAAPAADGGIEPAAVTAAPEGAGTGWFDEPSGVAGPNAAPLLSPVVGPTDADPAVPTWRRRWWRRR